VLPVGREFLEEERVQTCTTNELKKHLHSHHQAQFKEFEWQEEAQTASEKASKESGSEQGQASHWQYSLELQFDRTRKPRNAHQPCAVTDHNVHSPNSHGQSRIMAYTN